jgi:hypothetical protein
MMLGLTLSSSQVGAVADTPRNALGKSVNAGPAHLFDWFVLEWGWLIAIVLIALVVVARNHRKVPRDK